MNKKKILKLLLFIVIILIVIFLAFTICKMMILKKLNQNVAKYLSSDSYYEKIINDTKDTKTITEYYCKGDNAVLFLNTTVKDTGETRRLTNYYKGEKTNTYIEADGNKIALLDSNGLPSRIMIRQVDIGNNLWDLFLISLATSIKSEEYEGKECYVLSLDKTSETYIEKETGLALKANEGIVVDENGNETVQEIEYYYDFNSIDDSILKEPNINEYKIQENNN